jgi:hypothetical protein
MKICSICIWIIVVALQGVKMSGSDQITATTQDVPAFHNSAPTGHDADALDAKEFNTDPKMHTIYDRANQSRKVLYQLPCYCKCTRYLKHTSLLSCFREKHATTCEICQKEALYAYDQTKKGQTVAQIRKEVVKGSWKTVDVDAYVSSSQDKK